MLVRGMAARIPVCFGAELPSQLTAEEGQAKISSTERLKGQQLLTTKTIEIQIFNRDDLHSPQKETGKRPVRATGRPFQRAASIYLP